MERWTDPRASVKTDQDSPQLIINYIRGVDFDDENYPYEGPEKSNIKVCLTSLLLYLS